MSPLRLLDYKWSDRPPKLGFTSPISGVSSPYLEVVGTHLVDGFGKGDATF